MKNRREQKKDRGIVDTDTLIARARAGDKRAIDRLLQEARPRALAVATKVLRSPSDAEDAVQDALCKIWRYLPRFEGRASFFTWVHRIVMNACLDLLRRQKVRSELRDDDAETAGAAGALELISTRTPEDALMTEEARTLVHAALDRMSEAHREAVRLRELEACSYEEIALRAACPVGTVMSRLHHARRKLAIELESVLRGEQDLVPQAA